MQYLEYKLGQLKYADNHSSNIHEEKIKNYIDTWNNLKKISFNTSFKLRIVYHSCEDLYGGNEYCFCQDEFCLDEDKNDTKHINRNGLVPSIHLTLFDIFKESKMLPEVTRYCKIVDSSIWNYYVPIEIKNDTFDYTLFNHALEEIAYNTEKDLYQLSIANEYADLHARLVKQSHLNGNHKAVSPFLFHSENEMRDKLQEFGLNGEYDGQKKVINEVKRYKWRFLLVDDKSIECMSKVNVNGNKSNDVNKLQVISNNLSRILDFKDDQIWFRAEFEESQGSQKKELIPLKYGMVKEGNFNNGEFTTTNKKPNEDENIQIIIDCVENIKEAQKCLEYYEYEIILLDYLLDKNDDQEYGYQLLNDLYDLHKENIGQSVNSNIAHIKIGPNDRLSIMFISAFTTAVHERILEKGFGRSEKGLWFIGNSACPTNTPYLFSYQLLQLMSHRTKGLKKISEGQLFTIIELLEEIYVKAGNLGIESVRKKANYHFNHLLFMRAKYKRLRNDLEEKEEKELRGYHIDSQYVTNYLMDMKSSLLVYSAFKVVHHFSEAFFDHLQHLVYLTAFGTIRQWQDMWEEYVFIYNELYEYDNYVVDNEGKKQDRGKKICNAIKEYIINLKENCI